MQDAVNVTHTLHRTEDTWKNVQAVCVCLKIPDHLTAKKCYYRSHQTDAIGWQSCTHQENRESQWKSPRPHSPKTVLMIKRIAFKIMMIVRSKYTGNNNNNNNNENLWSAYPVKNCAKRCTVIHYILTENEQEKILTHTVNTSTNQTKSIHLTHLQAISCTVKSHNH